MRVRLNSIVVCGGTRRLKIYLESRGALLVYSIQEKTLDRINRMNKKAGKKSAT